MPQPKAPLRPVDQGGVILRPSTFSNRAALNRQYLLELQEDNLLQNHRFEAGLWGPPGQPEGIHWGWESPNSMVRGHFLGHWLSAAAHHVAASRGDDVLRDRARRVVAELARCQEENGGEWVAGMPERYLDRVARGRASWAPQYVASKTLMGLWDAFALLGDEQALDVLIKAAPWFHRWSMRRTREEMDDILDFETCGMLEVWADLYGHTRSQEHLDLIERYDRRRLFDGLLAGRDVLTNRHANTTIPEVLGAARAYEVTGEQRWRDVVEAYWRSAVTDRGTFCTGGQTMGEAWTPPGHLSARLGDTTQEHCTVYNLLRLAEYLFRWTGDPVYADHRERSLWNGILAQQHPQTGMVTYYLPMRSGSRKTWGTRTESFWCCYGTLVQAHSQHAGGSYYLDDAGLVVAGFIPADVRFEHRGQPFEVTVEEDPPDRRVPPPGSVDLSASIPATRPDAQHVHLRVRCPSPTPMALRLRLPWWMAGPAAVQVDGVPVDVVSTTSSFVAIERTWSDEVVHLRLPRAVTVSRLPDRPDTVAFLEGPVVLAGLCSEERGLSGDPAHPETLLTPDDELRFVGQWSLGYRTVGQTHGVRFIPLHEVVDQPYSLYFPILGPA